MATQGHGKVPSRRERGGTRDAARRKQANKAPCPSAEYLRTVIANLPIILWVLDRDGVFMLSEGKGLGALMLKAGEVVGRSIFDVYRDVPQILEDSHRALACEAFRSIVEMAGQGGAGDNGDQETAHLTLFS